MLQDLYARAQREPVDSERVHIALQDLDMDSDDSDGETRLGRAEGPHRRAARCARAAPIKPNI